MITEHACSDCGRVVKLSPYEIKVVNGLAELERHNVPREPKDWSRVKGGMTTDSLMKMELVLDRLLYPQPQYGENVV